MGNRLSSMVAPPHSPPAYTLPSPLTPPGKTTSRPPTTSGWPARAVPLYLHDLPIETVHYALPALDRFAALQSQASPAAWARHTHHRIPHKHTPAHNPLIVTDTPTFTPTHVPPLKHHHHHQILTACSDQIGESTGFPCKRSRVQNPL